MARSAGHDEIGVPGTFSTFLGAQPLPQYIRRNCIKNFSAGETSRYPFVPFALFTLFTPSQTLPAKIRTTDHGGLGQPPIKRKDFLIANVLTFPLLPLLVAVDSLVNFNAPAMWRYLHDCTWGVSWLVG